MNPSVRAHLRSARRPRPCHPRPQQGRNSYSTPLRLTGSARWRYTSAQKKGRLKSPSITGREHSERSDEPRTAALRHHQQHDGDALPGFYRMPGNAVRGFDWCIQQRGVGPRSLRDGLQNTQVYPNPETYPPSSVFTIIANMQQPAIPPGCEPSDWAAVCIQIRTEVSNLVQLYDFQNNLQLGILAVNQALANSFAMAQNTINDNSSKSLSCDLTA